MTSFQRKRYSELKFLKRKCRIYNQQKLHYNISAQRLLFHSIQNVFKFLYQGLMPVGHSNIGDIGSCDVIAPWTFLTEVRANPVLLDLYTSNTVYITTCTILSHPLLETSCCTCTAQKYIHPLRCIKDWISTVLYWHGLHVISQERKMLWVYDVISNHIPPGHAHCPTQSHAHTF